jgi:hypothetical protein
MNSGRIMKTRDMAAAGLAIAFLATGLPTGTAAQTDFYNLDKDRPLRVEDAYATKRYAWEWKAAPLALSQLRDGTVRYQPSLELKHGLLPGLEVSAGVGLDVHRTLPHEARRASTELEVSTLLNLTTETRWLPALGVRVTGHVPLEDQDDRLSLEVKGLATRSLGGPWRAHLNAGWILTQELDELHGPLPGVRPGHGPPEVWWAGLALDYALPFRHTLLLADTWVSEREQWVGDDESRTTVQSTVGLRHQLSPTTAIDAGLGRAWSGPAGADWRLNLGLTYEFGVRALMPRPRDVGTAAGPALAAPAPAPSRAGSPVERVYHPMHLPAQHNWSFRDQYPAADRLFAAFDFGHGILYETLWTRPDAPVSLLEEEIYQRLTMDILRNPPRMHMPERSFMPRYARLVPLAKEMFEWAHVLHRQAYDILADDDVADKDAAMDGLLAYYLSSPLAFTDVPKGMAIMDEQYFSKEFRQRYPKFNGLIWAYHWLQVAVHEPLLLHDTPEERQTAMNALLARFWQMLEDPPSKLPSEMPMTAAIAPEFTERYPRFAAIFDNLHMMHDVISDILVSDQVDDKRREIYRQADLFRDPDAMAVSREEWIAMAIGHGLDAQGGPAVGILPPAPTAGAAAHDHGAHDPAAPGHMGHEMPDTARAAMNRAMALVVRLLDDEHVQHRIHATPELHRAWEDPGVRRGLEMMRRMHGEPDPEGPPAHPAHPAHPDHAPTPPAMHDPARHEHEAMRQDPGMRAAMAFVVRLLADPQIQHRIHVVPEFHDVWEDPGVQAHFQMMRRMHGAEGHGHEGHHPAHDPIRHHPVREPGHEHRPADPAQPELHHAPGHMGHEMPDTARAAMHRAMALVVRLLDDEHVQHRIRATPELHHAWEDPGVRRGLEMMRRMHGDPGPEDPPAHPAHPDHQPTPPPLQDPARHDHAAMHQDPGGRAAMAFVVRLMDDAGVRQRIQAVAEYREVWEDPAVQAHFEMMRRMHGPAGHGHEGHRPTHDH